METLATYIAANRHYPFDELFELLQGQGFSFGIDTIETAHYLIMKAIESGNLERLDMWLCPVLAHSAEQQALFSEIYKRLFVPFLLKLPETVEKEEKQPIPTGKSRAATTGDSARQLQKEAREENEKIVASLKARSSGSYMLERFVQSTEIESDPVLLRVVRQLRYTEHSGRYSFNIEKTICQTIHEGGMAKPVFTPARRHVEYLMLIDRHNSRDHQARLHNNLYETLKANNIFVERFYFGYSPLHCSNDRYPGGIALKEILSLHEHAVLLLFTDGLQFVDTRRARLFAWSDIFTHWQRRYFYTSETPALWGERERLLQGVFPFVLPLSVEGMHIMAADLSSDAGTDFDCLHYWPDNADYSLVPVQTRGKKLDYIGLFFDDQLRRWIAASAIYPELDWNLTLALGKMFSTEKSVLPSYKSISQLLRLNWFVKGSISDDFRRELQQQWLTFEERAQVYQFLYDQLSQNRPLQGEADFENCTLQLAVYELLAQTDKERFEKKARQLVTTLEQTTDLLDMVSIHLINEHEYTSVFFEIPDDVLRLMGLDPAQIRKARKVPRNFVRIPEGEFAMGSPEEEPGRAEAMELYQKNNLDYSETQHQVKVSEFYLCKYAVTLAEFKKFIDESGYQTDAEKENSSFIWDEKEWKDKEGINWRHGVSGNERAPEEDNHPVLHVSWNDAVAYCKWMSNKTGKSLRLPTEAEWEYACRAGTTTPFNTGENLTTDQANYDGNYPYNNNKPGEYLKNTVAVDRYAPNAWGVYNMHGNVWEWCGDWFEGKYYEECKAKGTVPNPSGPETGSGRVLRGGRWNSGARSCRSADRCDNTPGGRSSGVGFRLVFVP
jgi:formylglycine-generating enzyme required for sulfatase activity